LKGVGYSLEERLYQGPYFLLKFGLDTPGGLGRKGVRVVLPDFSNRGKGGLLSKVPFLKGFNPPFFGYNNSRFNWAYFKGWCGSQTARVFPRHSGLAFSTGPRFWGRAFEGFFLQRGGPLPRGVKRFLGLFFWHRRRASQGLFYGGVRVYTPCGPTPGNFGARFKKKLRRSPQRKGGLLYIGRLCKQNFLPEQRVCLLDKQRGAPLSKKKRGVS